MHKNTAIIKAKKVRATELECPSWYSSIAAQPAGSVIGTAAHIVQVYSLWVPLPGVEYFGDYWKVGSEGVYVFKNVL